MIQAPVPILFLSPSPQTLFPAGGTHKRKSHRLRRFEGGADITQSQAALPPVKDAQDLARQVGSVDTALQNQRGAHSRLDEQRDLLANEVTEWSREKRFVELPQSISQQFANKRSDQLEEKASFYASQLEDRILEIERKLGEANKHHERVVNVVASAVEEGLSPVNNHDIRDFSARVLATPGPGS